MRLMLRPMRMDAHETANEAKDANGTRPAKKVVVATHGYCLDGLCSAAMFTRLLRHVEAGALRFDYAACTYGPGQNGVDPKVLSGDVNAVLDYRFSIAPQLTWYFDHHVTGFASPAERDTALGGAAVAPDGRPQVFWQPTYGSCAKLIADIARDRFGVDMSPLAELIGWADIIDTARFPSAEAATTADEPVLQLAAVIEHHGDGPFLNALVPQLLERPLAEIARSAEVQAQWGPILAARDAFVRRVERAAEVRGPVVLVDLTDAPLEVAAKFVTYARYPQCTYSVMLTRNKQHFKLSVGYNPWSGVPRGHDIAAICRRYDGGGHPAVGACSFPLSAEARAREAARAVTEELAR